MIAANRLTRICMVAVLVAASACSNDSHKAEPPKPTSLTRPAPHEFAVVLDDAGLHGPPEPRPAAKYTLSFADRRSRRGIDQRVAIALGPNGPTIVFLTLPAGARREVVLSANVGAHVVINGVPQRDLSASFNIVPSKEYPTPAT